MIVEETIAIPSLLASDVFRDFPGLKRVISHGGGAIPYQVGRFLAGAARTLRSQLLRAAADSVVRHVPVHEGRDRARPTLD
ncbi:MAG: amidohydrolase family protein [Solirubrobacterales bacterium]|nr:amidohydrolase family protein [Solirubrobacterales bacterium]MBV9716809.1 amidohydrolase family protein [Solirubrobacterales bacterium]